MRALREDRLALREDRHSLREHRLSPREDRLSLREDRLALSAVAGLTVIAALLRFWRIGHQGFWFDEGNTALLVHFPLGRMLGLVPDTESTPPLYYCVAWVWARIFGYGETGLRSLSVLAGVATVPLAWLAATRLAGRRTGLIVAALTACNPFLVWYSQEARSYSLVVLLSAAALAAFAFAEANPRNRRALAVWSAASGLALVTHYYAVVAVAPQAAWLLFRHWRRKEVQIAVAVAGVVGLALIPLALSQHSTGHDSWIAHAPLGVRLRQIVPQLLIGTGAPARTVLKLVALAVAAAGVVGLVFGSRSFTRRGGLIAGGLALSGFLLSLAFAGAGSDALITRNIIALWLPAAIAVGAGLVGVPGVLRLGSSRGSPEVASGGTSGGSPGGLPVGASDGSAEDSRGAVREDQRVRARLVGPVLALVLCGIGVTAVIGVSLANRLQRPDWRLVARALGPAGAGGGRERLILIQHYRTLLPLSLYLPGLRFVGHHTAHGVREIDVIAMSSPQQPLCWWGAACNLIPSAMQDSYAIPGFHVAGRRQVRQFTVLRLTSGEPRNVSPREVSRALRTTTLRRDALLVQR